MKHNEAETNTGRRDLMRQATVLGLMLSAGILRAGEATAAWNQEAFDAKDMAGLMKSFGGALPTESKDITLTAPEIAENGAVVPVTVATTIASPQEIAILVEKNPNILTALFDVSRMGTSSVTTRIKMGQTSDVHALVKADGKYFFTMKEVKVTLGGCGG